MKLRYFVENADQGVLEIEEADSPVAALQAYGEKCIVPQSVETLTQKGFVVREMLTGGRSALTGELMSKAGPVVYPPRKTVKFYSGDLLNGNINPFDTYEEAFADYKDMAEGCAQTDRGDETVSREQAVAESLAFHYVVKVTTTLDADGEVVKEDVEILDGGDAEACGFTQ